MKYQNRADALTMEIPYSPYMMLNICIINHDSCPVLFGSLMAQNKEHTFVQTCQLHVDLVALEECLNVAFICALLTCAICCNIVPNHIENPYFCS